MVKSEYKALYDEFCGDELDALTMSEELFRLALKYWVKYFAVSGEGLGTRSAKQVFKRFIKHHSNELEISGDIEDICSGEGDCDADIENESDV